MRRSKLFANIFLGLAALLVAAPAPARAGTTEKSAADAPDRLFETSLKLHEGKSYEAAREGFAAYREYAIEADQPQTPRYVEATFYEAECLYLEGDKVGAHELYRLILEKHKNFARIAEVINREYEIGTAFIEGKAEKPLLGFLWGTTSRSLGAEILEHLIENYQQNYFDNAQKLVADHYFRERDWRRAADHYIALENGWRERPLATEAQYQRGICYLRMCRGYRYDQTWIQRGEEVLVDYVKRYPTGNRIREAEKALAEIRASRAKLYIENAHFYLFRERRPRAALVYVDALLREAPDAPSAAEAPAILEDIAAKAEEKDPATAAHARELLAELKTRPPGPAPARPPVLVPAGGIQPASSAPARRVR